MVNLAKILDYLRRNRATGSMEILVNFLGPFLIYDFTKKGLGDVGALMASSAPPIAWSLYEFARKRRVDALSILVLSGIALSLLAFVGGGGARFLQLREKLVTALIGLIFLGSAAIGRPLIYQLARANLQRRDPGSLESFEARRDDVYFRRTMRNMTLVWGFGLVAEAAIAVLLVLTLSIRNYLLVSPVVGYGAIGALSLWSWWYARRQIRKGEARRALAAAEAAGVNPEAGS
jgi:hypothetical protein